MSQATAESRARIETGVDPILLGRTTYRMLRDYFPTVTDPDDLVATKLNGLPEYVAFHHHLQGGRFSTTVLSGDIVELVRQLKVRPGRHLQIHGSWRRALTSHAAGVIDECRLLVSPVTVGEGKRLFATDGPRCAVRSWTRATGEADRQLGLD